MLAGASALLQEADSNRCLGDMSPISCAKEDSQFIIVTHSPILLGIPDAEILSFDSGEIHPIEYEDTDSYKITEMFINSREQILKRLLR